MQLMMAHRDPYHICRLQLQVLRSMIFDPLMQAYLKAVELLIELASLQTAFLTLDEAIKTTNRRVNALDNVVRPRLENTIAYIKVPLRAIR